MLTANRSTSERGRPTGCGRPSGEGGYAHGANVARPRADGGAQASLLAEQRGLGNNLAERRVGSAWSEKATGRDSVNATISMRTEFLVGTAPLHDLTAGSYILFHKTPHSRGFCASKYSQKRSKLLF